MHARQVMSRPVVTVPADATVYAAAGILLGARVSAAPVIDADGRLIGMVSEADLMNRPEVGTVPGKSWLQRLLTDNAVLARDYIRSHSHHVADVMTRNVVSAGERTSLEEIATLMRQHGIKRIPIVRDGKVIGVVSRSNLLQGLLAREPRAGDSMADDESIRSRIFEELDRQSWGSGITNVVVEKGVASLWGSVASDAVKRAAQIAVENVAGVTRVVNNVAVIPWQAQLSP